MKYAADFRRIAREALSGKWMIAVLVGLVATLLGGAGSGGPELKLNIDGSGAHANFEFAGQTIFSTGGGLNSDIGAFLFIGWDILSSLTLGIGNLWLRPYKQAANAAFYREISGTGYAAFDPSYS